MESTALKFNTDINFAMEMDANDKLASYRQEFFHPINAEGKEKIYLSGNSLGLQPVATPKRIQNELYRWQTMGAEAHHAGDLPWSSYQQPLKEYLTHIVGASSNEIVLMNGLSVNIHLMLVSFYHPTPDRYKILISEPMFPSDRYAVQSFLAMKGYDPDDAIIYWKTAPNSLTHDIHDLEKLLKEQGEQISLIWLEGVNFLSGQALDMAKITRLGHEYGSKVGFDLAHTVGNIPLKLHDWDVDFAAWCSYKYLNGGPGAIAGCYINEKYVREPLAQLAGWYGNDPKTRFQFAHDFEPFSRSGTLANQQSTHSCHGSFTGFTGFVP